MLLQHLDHRGTHAAASGSEHPSADASAWRHPRTVLDPPPRAWLSSRQDVSSSCWQRPINFSERSHRPASRHATISARACPGQSWLLHGDCQGVVVANLMPGNMQSSGLQLEIALQLLPHGPRHRGDVTVLSGLKGFPSHRPAPVPRANSALALLSSSHGDAQPCCSAS